MASYSDTTPAVHPTTQRIVDAMIGVSDEEWRAAMAGIDDALDLAPGRNDGPRPAYYEEGDAEPDEIDREWWVEQDRAATEAEIAEARAVIEAIREGRADLLEWGEFDLDPMHANDCPEWPAWVSEQEASEFGVFRPNDGPAWD